MTSPSSNTHSTLPPSKSNSSFTGVQTTALLTAGARALETLRPPEERLVNDPLAARLAGGMGRELAKQLFGVCKEAYKDLGLEVEEEKMNFVAERTAWFDKELGDYLAARGEGCKQVVILGSGMDTRAYRLKFPGNSTTKVYELDYGSIHTYKSSQLDGIRSSSSEEGGEGGSVVPSSGSEVKVVEADMADSKQWSVALIDAGFEASDQTAWIAEGLVYYLPSASLPAFAEAISYLSSTGSCFLFDGFPDLAATKKRLPTVNAWFEEQGISFISEAEEVLLPMKKEGWTERKKVETAQGLTRYAMEKGETEE